MIEDNLPVTVEEWQDFANTHIHRIRTDPVWFMQIVFKIELDIWQKEAFEAMADVVRHYYGEPTKYNHATETDGPLTKFSIRAMHGPGKTFFAAAAIIWLQRP